MRLSAVGLMLALALGFLVASLVAETPRQAMPVIGYLKTVPSNMSCSAIVSRSNSIPVHKQANI